MGEDGPELFIPNTHGVIVPNNKTMDMLGSNGININIYDPVVRDESDLYRLAEMVKDTLSEELADALRMGGSL